MDGACLLKYSAAKPFCQILSQKSKRMPLAEVFRVGICEWKRCGLIKNSLRRPWFIC